MTQRLREGHYDCSSEISLIPTYPEQTWGDLRRFQYHIHRHMLADIHLHCTVASGTFYTIGSVGWRSHIAFLVWRN